MSRLEAELDTDWAMQIVSAVAGQLRRESATAWDDLPDTQADRLRSEIDRTTEASLKG